MEPVNKSGERAPDLINEQPNQARVVHALFDWSKIPFNLDWCMHQLNKTKIATIYGTTENIQLDAKTYNIWLDFQMYCFSFY